MAEQKRNTRNTKSTKVQPVNDYGRIQPQAPELEEAIRKGKDRLNGGQQKAIIHNSQIQKS